MENNFDLTKVKNFSLKKAKLYIDKYFIPLTDGNHAFYVNGKYEIYEDAVIKKTYFKRMSSELNKYYFQEKIDLRTITYNINKPVLFDNYLNLCPNIIQTYKKVDEFSTETHEKLNIILAYIKETLCSGKIDSYEFLIKWLSNMIHGNRNQSALYLKGPQGAGKSTLLEFIRKYVLGNELCFQGGSSPLRSRFNGELSGKLMVVFEELENFSASEWISISSVLKRQITSPTLMIECKGKDVREEINLNNYILISNNDAIQDDDGRRFNILDISAKNIGNREYFNKLYSCFNDEVGQLFYSYLMDISLVGYNSQSYPITQAKLDSFSKRLDSVYKFLKDEFILTKKDIKRQTVQELYDWYVGYCNNAKRMYKIKNKIEFNNTLSDVGIKWKQSNCQNVYKMSYDDLKKISDKLHWVHELDEYKTTDESYDNGIDKSDKSVDVNNIIFNEKIELLEEENKDMREYIKRLEKDLLNFEKQHCKIEEKKPKKKVVVKEDFLQISDTTFLNSNTNETYEVVNDLDMEDDEPLF
jgi:hypothetical protein